MIRKYSKEKKEKIEKMMLNDDLLNELSPENAAKRDSEIIMEIFKKEIEKISFSI